MNPEQHEGQIVEEKPYEGDANMDGYSDGPKESIVKRIIKNAKYLYSFDELMQEIELNSGFLKNRVYLGNDEINSMILKREKDNNLETRRDLKTVAYQTISRALYTLTNDNSIEILSIGPEGKRGKFNIYEKVHNLAVHPFIPFTFALAFENEVKIFEGEDSTVALLNKERRNPRNAYLKDEVEFGKFSTIPTKILNVKSTALQFSPDGKYLAMVHRYSNVLKVLDFDTGKIKEIKVQGSTFNKLKWSPSGSHLAVISKLTKQLLIFYAGTWEYTTFRLESKIKTLEWNKEGSSLFVFCPEEHNKIIEFIDNEADKITTGRERNMVYFLPRHPNFLELGENESLLEFCFFKKDNHIELCYLTQSSGDDYNRTDLVHLYVNGARVKSDEAQSELTKTLLVAKYCDEYSGETSDLIYTFYKNRTFDVYRHSG